ncbi:MAG: hypothetical protein H7061_12220 [Bdellovibrionaceae bacterium]|nr:hypothetical protein [Bdellovibrio sp.]
MKSGNKMKDTLKNELFAKKIKKEDPIELPMDEKFFENMHNQIMQAVEQIEVKPPSRWAKTWIFLETTAQRQRGLTRKIIKTGFAGLALLTGLGLVALCAQIYIDVKEFNNMGNQSKIIKEAKKNPVEWSELVVSYQNENDFYADVLSQKSDLRTIVEIDRVITESL